ncbi:uncharacterized protein V6R79_011027 [Siganus canaliculatus]
MGAKQSHEQKKEEEEEKQQHHEESTETKGPGSGSASTEDSPGELPQCQMGNRKVDNMCFMISCTNCRSDVKRQRTRKEPAPGEGESDSSSVVGNLVARFVPGFLELSRRPSLHKSLRAARKETNDGLIRLHISDARYRTRKCSHEFFIYRLHLCVFITND